MRGGERRMNTRRRVFCAVLAVLALGGCSGTRFFYYPNRVLYVDPRVLGIDYDLVAFRSDNGDKLYALMFRTEKKPKGTIVHFHGNFGNVSNHFKQCQFLTRDGFDVMTFDYEGYGGSEGRPSPRRCVADGLAAVRYARKISRNPRGGVALFGQSLGGAVAVVVAAKDPEVRGVVVEAAFATYRSMARDVLERSAFTWILVPIFPLFVGNAEDPLRFVDKIAPRPVLFVHGDKDNVVPLKMSEILYKKAKEPKALWIVPGANHLGCRRQAGEEYEKRLSDFFTQALND
jgi:fermentation-respiration switch protein FrsA (DUF1100 family)